MPNMYFIVVLTIESQIGILEISSELFTTLRLPIQWPIVPLKKDIERGSYKKHEARHMTLTQLGTLPSPSKINEYKEAKMMITIASINTTLYLSDTRG